MATALDRINAINSRQGDTRRKRKLLLEDKILYAITYTVLFLLFLVVAYPVIYVLSCSFSSGNAVASARVILWPVEPSVIAYQLVFKYKTVWIGFANSIFYTVFATSFSVFMSVILAYPLSRLNYQGRKFVMKFLTVSMIVSPSIIPKYLLMSSLHLTNTRLGIIINGCLSISNTMIIRSYMQSNIPGELIEAARLDGCSELRTLLRVVMPLSKAVLAVVTLYYGVGNWNNYFEPMIYLRDPNKYPLQMVLRTILNATRVDLSEVDDPALVAKLASSAELVKYALMVITSVPVIIAYPLVQKFFQKGIMVGSLKG